MVVLRMGKKQQINLRGFTLIELIIVIAIIAILASAIFVAVDPARRLHESRNARRWSDVTQILEAVVKYQTDNGGTHYTNIANVGAGTAKVIGTCAANANTSCGGKITDQSCLTLTSIGSNYLAKTPKDPSTGTDEHTDYYLVRGANNEITVGACDPEGEGAGGAGTAPTIELSR